MLNVLTVIMKTRILYFDTKQSKDMKYRQYSSIGRILKTILVEKLASFT